jgi:toxin HigB-1
MEVVFGSRKMQKTFSSEKELVRAFGDRRARLIMRRLADIAAAATLADLSRLPPVRCHQLTGGRAGQLAVDLDHPWRLVLEPAEDPVPTTGDGGLSLARVTRVRILGVVDYH